MTQKQNHHSLDLLMHVLLHIQPKIPPLGFKTFFVREATVVMAAESAKVSTLTAPHVIPRNVEADITIENDVITYYR